MGETKNTENETKETKNEKGRNSGAVKRTLTGGLIGATVGYLATPENRKKWITNMSKDALKSAGTSLGQAVKEKSKKAVDALKNTTGKVFYKKQNVSTEGYVNEGSDSDGNETRVNPVMEKKTDSPKEKSSNKDEKKVDDRLDRLEEMLTQLIKEKEDSNDKGQESKIAS